MRKNNILVILLSLFLISADVYAQSELDLFAPEEFDIETITDSKNKNKNEVLDDKSDDINTKDIKDEVDEEDNDNNEQEPSETWLRSLLREGSKNFFKSEEEKIIAESEEFSKKILKQKSNAAFFDISGVKLRMSPKLIEEKLVNQGYTKVVETMEVPNFIKWRSEEICRTNGIVGFERLKTCATKIAQENGYQYVNRQSYSRQSTRETIDITFSSTFTNNLSYRIFYKSNVTFSQSKSSKNIYLNNIKIYDFWRRVALKYGDPDNKTEVKWGKGGKKPYLKAKIGELELFDPLLLSLDTTRMFQADSRLSNTKYYNF